MSTDATPMRRHHTYEEWARGEDVPLVEGYHIADLAGVEVRHWPRFGVPGALVRLEGTEDMDDGYVLEIPPGGGTTPQRHLFEALVYVVAGRGATTVWQGDGGRQTFEWQRHSLFAIPLNTSYQHFNGQGGVPARLFAVTNAPLVMNVFHSPDFVYHCPYDFHDRFEGADGFFSGEGRAYAGRIWESNFVPDISNFPLQALPERGAEGRNAMLELGDGVLCAHISEFPVGTYKKAHRHGAGAHVIIIGGEGYSLMWPQGTPPRRFDWRPGSVIVPPDQWFHQHFNTGTEPARYLALRWGSRKYPVFKRNQVDISVTAGSHQIEYEDEDPAVRRMFEESLAKHGAVCRMPPVGRPA